MKNIIGYKFGSLTVKNFIKSVPRTNGGYEYWYKCLCDCGNYKEATYYRLKYKATSRCDACASKRVKLVGKKYGILSVIEDAGSNNGKSVFLCRCECGNEKTIEGTELKRGHYKSCGCKKGKEPTTKEYRDHPLYEVWKGMKARCRDKKHNAFKNYGGRGIKVCKEWADNFVNFYYWSIQNGYKEGLVIDRANGDKDYEPTNCRWVTPKVNSRNTRRVKLNMQKADEIRKSKLPYDQLAKAYCVCKGTIQLVKSRKLWV